MELVQQVRNKQSQKLVMTRQMHQSIEILQMTAMEMQAHIDKELMENPMLEFDDPARETFEEPLESGDSKAGGDDSIDWQEYFEQEQELLPWNRSTGAPSDVPDDLERGTSKETTLHDYLLIQLHLLKNALSPKAVAVGEALLDATDEDGYLTVGTETIAGDLGVSQEDVEAVLNRIQTFDPAGVGARNLQECLAIQLRQLDLLTPVYQRLLDEYLLDIANNRLPWVASQTGVKVRELAEFKKKIRELNPRPGSCFEEEKPVEYVIPDGSIEWTEGVLSVRINELSAPHLSLNRTYKNMLKNEACGAEARTYIFEKMNAALQLIRNIEARRHTVQRITIAIAQYQEDYFTGRCASLKPLTLRQVEDMVQVHESTVSRAIRGKFIQTPIGVMALKSFFQRGYGSADDEISSGGIKEMLRSLIQEENREHPLSDQKLSEQLKGAGFCVARRTVAKYREEMGIPTTSRRKEIAI